MLSPASARGFALRHALALAALLALQPSSHAGTNDDMFEMSDKLDQLDHQDLADAIDKANACTLVSRFDCTETQLGKAAKFANSASDRKRLASAQQNMVDAKARIAEEARLQAEEERRIAQAEENLRIADARAAQRARDAEEEARQSNASTQGVLAILGAAAIARGAKGYSESQRSSLVENWTRDRANAANGITTDNFGNASRTVEQQRLAEARAQVAAARQARQQQPTPLAPARVATPASPSTPPPSTPPTPTPARLALAPSPAKSPPAKVYMCPAREYITQLLYYRTTMTAPTDLKSLMATETESLTLAQACGKIDPKVREFVASVGDGKGYTYSRSVVKSVDLCRLTKSGDQAVVYINLEVPQEEPCDTPSSSVAK